MTLLKPIYMGSVLRRALSAWLFTVAFAKTVCGDGSCEECPAVADGVLMSSILMALDPGNMYGLTGVEDLCSHQQFVSGVNPYGIKVHCMNGNVWKVDTEGEKYREFTGVISPLVGCLEDLVYFRISGHPITGTVPEALLAECV